ncbi:hypothetical protein [Agrilutibacter solisilvae]|uniref:Uncharacterized protein n=1 Tax=Agrilutibacter solisilvae TaxID=2763317 RepID=A0A974XYL7_9GAMM|nr:hypothetical protein [Lysobacter solisilvae]QSX77250.1 hypothetical protein I8J32_010655 [Lysobacter solisilvae]
MTRRRLSRLTLVPLLVSGAIALIWLAFLLLRQAWSIGVPEGLMVAMTLVFVVALPLALPVLSWAGQWGAHEHRGRIVPMAGGKVP